MRKVTREELTQGDGREGRPALVVVDGKVYDVTASKLWAGGEHMNVHPAGKDLSQEILGAPHSNEVLERVTLVGELVEGEKDGLEGAAPAGDAGDAATGPGKTGTVRAASPSGSRAVPGIVKRLQPLHPHPMSVHFPIALSLAAALFTLLRPILGASVLEQVALYNLVLAALSSPAAVAAGLMSWYYSYGSAWTPIFRGKFALSLVLMALAWGAVIMRLAAPGLFGPGGVGHAAYVVLVLALAPTVILLGYLGGNITFPRSRR